MANTEDKKFVSFLTNLKKEGNIETVPSDKAKRIFEKMTEALEPLNFESRLKQAGSEQNASTKFFNI